MSGKLQVSIVSQFNKKAGIKAKLMTGKYVLQSVCAQFNQCSLDATCLLCGENTEDHTSCCGVVPFRRAVIK